MKIRFGFVSNSSSSSFTCDVCKETAVDYDGECEIEHLSCPNGHDMCSKHVKGRKKKSIAQMRQVLLDDVDTWGNSTEDKNKEKELINGFTNEEVEDSYNDFVMGGMSEDECPLCSFKILTDEDLLDYLLMLTGSTKKSMIEGALKNYPNYDAFVTAIKAHKKAMKEQGKK